MKLPLFLDSSAADKTLRHDLARPFHAPEQTVMQVWEWLSEHWLNIAIAFAAGLAIYGLLRIARRWGRRLFAREASPGLSVVIGRAVARTSHLFMALVAARLVIGYANPPGWLFDITRFTFTVVAVFQVTIWVREVVLGVIERHADPDTGYSTISNAMGIIRLLVTVALFVIAAVVILDNVGVNVSGLLAGLGIGGIAIGLAAQGIFSDLFAALSIIFDKPFRTGDSIRYDQTQGTVERIGLKSTRLRAVTGERKIISNTQLLNREITNFVNLDHRRLKFTVPVPLDTPAAVAGAIPDILRAAVEQAGASCVRAGLVNIGPAALDFEVEFDVRSPGWDEIYQTRHVIGIDILQRLAAQHVVLGTTAAVAPVAH